MPKARSSDRSLGLAHPLSKSYTNTSPFSSRCRLHSGSPDFNVAGRERGTTCLWKRIREAEMERERPVTTPDKGWRARKRGKRRVVKKQGRWGRKWGGEVEREGKEGKEGDSLSVGISTYDCPGGVHRSAKQSSPASTPWL